MNDRLFEPLDEEERRIMVSIADAPARSVQNAE